ncbi:CoA pyrophosphatase [Nocardia sp. CNY236]|uniref:NUDIX hydrolase n=1 Tax=Nocardia sp. CNY236 TaxID=1169152 RepID=UPI0003FA4C39|nr:CoA pyrophosphatase [Nocardia sp. CNY236]
MTIELPPGLPPWLAVAADPPEETIETSGKARALRRIMARTATLRQAAVLVLFGGSPEADQRAPGGLPADAEVLLTQRAATMRQHRGQVAFPGGEVDAADSGPIATALREANEETGLDPSSVEPFAVLPTLFVSPSRFDVTPVVAYWRHPGGVRVVDESETERVARVPLARLLDPANRFVVESPLGYRSPAFQVDGMLVWGLTGGILSGISKFAGWDQEWDQQDIRDLEAALAAVGMTL